MPPKAQDTVMVSAGALAEIVPVPLPFVSVRFVGSELFQVHESVMSGGVPIVGNIAVAAKVTLVLTATLTPLWFPFTVRVIEEGVPSLTVIVAVDELTVPCAAVIVVVHTPPGTVLGGETRPAELMVAHVVSLELHDTFPVKSCVEPSLKVPVADIWRVCFGTAVMVWFVGPMAMEESVGFTKNPVQAPAKATMESAEINPSLRLKACISSKSLNGRSRLRRTQHLAQMN